MPDLKLVFSIAALLVALGVLAMVQRNWLTLARANRLLAYTSRQYARMAQLRQSTDADVEKHLRAAQEFEHLAARLVRLAWPWKADVSLKPGWCILHAGEREPCRKCNAAVRRG